MKISAAFPSTYLKAADLQDKQPRVAISRVEFDKVGDDTKPIVYFQGKDRGLVLNKTNATTISMAYGDDTDDWEGCEVILYAAMVQFQNQMVEAIRIKIPPRKPAGKAPAVTTTVEQVKQQNTALSDDEMNDSIPF
jgi:hypothetical protein